MKGLVTKLIEIKSNQKQKRKEFLVITLGCVLCLGVLVAGTFMVGTIGKGNKKSDNGKNNIIDLNETDDSRLENETTGITLDDSLKDTEKSNGVQKNCKVAFADNAQGTYTISVTDGVVTRTCNLVVRNKLSDIQGDVITNFEQQYTDTDFLLWVKWEFYHTFLTYVKRIYFDFWEEQPSITIRLIP